MPTTQTLGLKGVFGRKVPHSHDEPKSTCSLVKEQFLLSSFLLSSFRCRAKKNAAIREPSNVTEPAPLSTRPDRISIVSIEHQSQVSDVREGENNRSLSIVKATSRENIQPPAGPDQTPFLLPEQPTHDQQNRQDSRRSQGPIRQRPTGRSPISDNRDHRKDSR